MVADATKLKQPVQTEEVRKSSPIVTNKSQKELRPVRQERAQAKAAASDDPEAVALVRALCAISYPASTCEAAARVSGEKVIAFQ